MASFLSFVYRRQTSAPASFESSSRNGEPRLSLRSSKEADAPRQFLPPGVSSSGSSETAWGAPHNISHDDSEDDDERFLSSPFTPEGLLPRKSVDSIRRELKIDMLPRTLEHSMRTKSSSKANAKGEFSGVAKILAGVDGDQTRVHPMSSPSAKQDHRQHTYCDDYDYDEDDDILPPPQYHLRSKSTFESSVQSPPVSTSSFYTKQSSSNSRPVAMSPVLQVGQARTAVGALVALREAANRHPNASMALSDTNTDIFQKRTANEKPTTQEVVPRRHSLPMMSVLPPRTKEFVEDDEYRTNDDDDDVSSQGDDENNGPFTPTNKRRSEGSFSTGSSYEPPLPSRGGVLMQGTMSQKGMITQLHSHQRYDFQAIPSSSTVSSKSSLISLGLKAEEQLSSEESAARSLHSLATSHEEEEEQPNPYDDNEEEFDGALMARKFRNQQMRKQQLAMQEEEPFAEGGDFDSDYVDDYGDEDAYEEDEEYDADDLAEEGAHCHIQNGDDRYTVAATNGVTFEYALLRRKARNQRQEKEMFLQEVVARLRDNLCLVADIESAASRTVAAMGSWFVKTPLDAENLLTGLSYERRTELLFSIDSILNEMCLAQPEEFIVSPSKVPVMAVSHDTLTQALHFCRALIVSAVPKYEKEEMMKELPCEDPHATPQQLFVWKSLPELQHALGISAPPHTPATVRGGGTSLFSLPEESGAETPHTSNLSVGSTIASVNTYSTRPRHAQQMRPRLILQQDGLQLRHTVEVVTSLLQKLSVACFELGELRYEKEATNSARKYVLVCDYIKELYLQLLTVKKEDAQALMGTFYLESQSPRTEAIISREVSADEEEIGEPSTQLVAPPPSPTFQAYHDRFQSQQQERSRTALLVDRLGASPASPISVPDTTQLPASLIESIPSQQQNDQPSTSRGVSLFSPSTEDMRSKASDRYEDMVPYEFDDLRRQVGSYDRDDNDDIEERDGPCEDGFETREGAEDWSRMYQNVSLAASSIRSLERQSKNNGRSM